MIAIIDKARLFSSRPHADEAVEWTSLCDFCSTMVYTSPNGYVLYLRLILLECDVDNKKRLNLFTFKSRTFWRYSSRVMSRSDEGVWGPYVLR